jgi:hypothetical protein
MTLPQQLCQEYSDRLNGLASEGFSLMHRFQHVPSTKGQYDHVPAAVLAGAVLEKALRVLCSQHQPPISVTGPGGKAKTLNPLIDSLKKANVFNEAKTKQLRAWADLRNQAAHGEFAEFARGDVEQMIKGITLFLAEHLK